MIFVVPWHTLRRYLLLAHELGMANGEYAFVCVHGDVSRYNSFISNIIRQMFFLYRLYCYCIFFLICFLFFPINENERKHLLLYEVTRYTCMILMHFGIKVFICFPFLIYIYIYSKI
jgi:hypothetical protein